MNPRPYRLWKTSSPRWPDLALGLLGALSAAVTIGVTGWIVWDLIRLGLPHLSWHFLTDPVESGGRAGGIGPVIVSTVMITSLSLVGAVPAGVAAAVWLSEYTAPEGMWCRAITGSIDLLASIPSILFGLFGMAFFCQFLGLGFSIISGSLTLACMILPVIVRTTLTAFRELPSTLRSSAAALGLAQYTILWKILLPSALPSIMVGVTLGVGRALAETAALIFTSGYATRWPSSPLDSGRALSVHIYDLAMNIPQSGPPASASTLVLLAILFSFNGIAFTLSRRGSVLQSVR